MAALKQITGRKKAQIHNWLRHQDAYTLHKPVRRKFVRRRIIVEGIDHQWQADLIDARKKKKKKNYYDGFAYLVTCIDVWSNYAWVVPLKDKTGQTLVDTFQVIFPQSRKPLKLQTEKRQ